MPDEPNENPQQDPSPEPNPPPPEPSADLAAARAELAAARAQLETLTQERDAAIGAAQQATEEATAQLTVAQQAALEAHRRAALAEHTGQVVPELVQGTTTEEIDASIEAAQAAYTRIAEAVRTATQVELNRSSLSVVPPGNSPRGEPSGEELSPLQKITGALSRNGR